MNGHAKDVSVDPRRRSDGKAKNHHRRENREDAPWRSMCGVQCDQMTGIVSRAGAVAGDMSTDGTGTGNGA